MMIWNCKFIQTVKYVKNWHGEGSATVGNLAARYPIFMPSFDPWETKEMK